MDFVLKLPPYSLYLVSFSFLLFFSVCLCLCLFRFLRSIHCAWSERGKTKFTFFLPFSRQMDDAAGTIKSEAALAQVCQPDANQPEVLKEERKNLDQKQKDVVDCGGTVSASLQERPEAQTVEEAAARDRVARLEADLADKKKRAALVEKELEELREANRQVQRQLDAAKERLKPFDAAKISEEQARRRLIVKQAPPKSPFEAYKALFSDSGSFCRMQRPVMEQPRMGTARRAALISQILTSAIPVDAKQDALHQLLGEEEAASGPRLRAFGMPA